MKIQEPKQKGIFTTTTKALLMATFAIAFSVTPALQSQARADQEVDLSKGRCSGCGFSVSCCHCWNGPRNVQNPNSKIAHGMRNDVGNHLLIESTGIREGSTTGGGALASGRGRPVPISSPEPSEVQ